MNSRLKVIDVAASRATQPLCDAVFSGLSQSTKTLPCRFFYDEAGSELFEQITGLPEYYLTRCETQILDRFSGEIVESMGNKLSMIEFGSGSSVKTRLLISAALAKQLKLDYAPVDISREFLVRSANDLLDTFPTLAITAIAAEYLDAVAHLPEADHPRLILFLGSNIGNFTREEAICFLSTIQSVLKPHDRILLGADLVKNRDVLHAAYNDASGLTAEFNFNLLRRINQDLNAKFDLDSFRHSAPFDESNSRIEMQLICTKPHSVFVEDLDTVFEFKEGEIVTTEFSHKYTPESIAELAQAAGLTIERQWTDDLGYFGEFLMGKELHG